MIKLKFKSTLMLSTMMSIATFTSSQSMAENIITVGEKGFVSFGSSAKGRVGYAKPYVFGPNWKSSHTNGATNVSDKMGDNSREFSFKLKVPANDGKKLKLVQKMKAVKNGLENRVTYSSKDKVRVRSACWSLYFNTDIIAGSELEIKTGYGSEKTFTFPVKKGKGDLWSDVVSKIKINGEYPVEIEVKPARRLLIQDMRKWGQSRFELRFNLAKSGQFDAGESQSSVFTVKPVAKTEVALDEKLLQKETDTTGWINWRCPWNVAPVDVSFLNEDVAGKHGFLTVKNGKFVFEDGTSVVLWGTNMTAGANFPSHKQAPLVAERIAKHGVNIVRAHHIDAPWSRPSVIDYSKQTSTEFDADALDRMQFFHAELKKRGIYIYLDLIVHRKFFEKDGVENASEMKNGGKPYAIIDPRMIELQKDFAKKIWSAVNPYTGLAPKDDPQYVLTGMTNEHDLFSAKVTLEPYRTRFEKRFRKWAKKKNITIPDEKIDFTNRTDAVMHFFVDVQIDFYNDFKKYLKEEVGIKIPITGSNWSWNSGLLKSLSVCDFTDSHAYQDHPSANHKRFRNEMMAGKKNNIYSYLAFNRLKGKPFFVSEWDQPWPNEWRAESQLSTAAVTALQGWDGATVYSYSHSSNEIDYVTFPFDNGLDPARFGLFPHGALIARRHASQAKEMKTIYVDPENALKSSNLKPSETTALFLTPEVTGVQMSFTKDKGDTIIEAKKEFVAQDSEEILSDNKVLYRNIKKKYGTINTPGTQAAYGMIGKVGKAIELSNLKIDIKTEFAVVAISSLTDDDITDSKKLLLTTVGRVNNSGLKLNALKTERLETGKSPMKLEPIVGTVSLKTSNAALKVFPINYLGEKGTEIKSTYKDGRLEFEVGNPAQTMYYQLQSN